MKKLLYIVLIIIPLLVMSVALYTSFTKEGYIGRLYKEKIFNHVATDAELFEENVVILNQNASDIANDSSVLPLFSLPKDELMDGKFPFLNIFNGMQYSKNILLMDNKGDLVFSNDAEQMKYDNINFIVYEKIYEHFNTEKDPFYFFPDNDTVTIVSPVYNQETLRRQGFVLLSFDNKIIFRNLNAKNVLTPNFFANAVGVERAVFLSEKPINEVDAGKVIKYYKSNQTVNTREILATVTDIKGFGKMVHFVKKTFYIPPFMWLFFLANFLILITFCILLRNYIQKEKRESSTQNFDEIHNLVTDIDTDDAFVHSAVSAKEVDPQSLDDDTDVQEVIDDTDDFPTEEEEDLEDLDENDQTDLISFEDNTIDQDVNAIEDKDSLVDQNAFENLAPSEDSLGDLDNLDDSDELNEEEISQTENSDLASSKFSDPVNIVDNSLDISKDDLNVSPSLEDNELTLDDMNEFSPNMEDNSSLDNNDSIDTDIDNFINDEDISANIDQMTSGLTFLENYENYLKLLKEKHPNSIMGYGTKSTAGDFILYFDSPLQEVITLSKDNPIIEEFLAKGKSLNIYGKDFSSVQSLRKLFNTAFLDSTAEIIFNPVMEGSELTAISMVAIDKDDSSLSKEEQDEIHDAGISLG